MKRGFVNWKMNLRNLPRIQHREIKRWKDKGSYSRLSGWMLHFWGGQAQMARKVQPWKKWESWASRQKWKTCKMLKVRKSSAGKVDVFEANKASCCGFIRWEATTRKRKIWFVWSGLQLQKQWLAGGLLQLRVKNFLTLRANHSSIHSFNHFLIIKFPLYDRLCVQGYEEMLK